MTFLISDRVISPKELLTEYPLSESERAFIQQSRLTIENLLSRHDQRLLLVVGPCSLHDEEATLEYAKRLQKLSHEVKDKFFIVMRSFVEKSRSASGWKGMVNDPHLDGSYDIFEGIKKSRRLLIKMTEMGLPLALEIVGCGATYFSDLLSLAIIGARTVSSQSHREIASSLPCPVGFKNCVSGSLSPALSAISVVRQSQCYLGIDEEGFLSKHESLGNPYGFLILRGGYFGSNYESHSIYKAIQELEKQQIFWPLLVDCAHDNCQKRAERQPEIFSAVMQQIKEGNEKIFGLMLESFLIQGAQPFSSTPRYGLSLTDPCLGWKETEDLIKLSL